MRAATRWVLPAVAALAVGMATCATAQQPDASHSHDFAFRPVDPAVVETFRSIPIQDGGRIKPMDTHARFLLLRMHGKRSMRLSIGDEAARISATEWLLTCLLYPERAIHYPTFTIDNSDVVVAIGAAPHAERRGRYSYSELYPARPRLYELVRQYSAVEDQLRSPHQAMIVNLANNMSDFEYLLQYLRFARDTVHVPAEAFPALDSLPAHLTAIDYLDALPTLRSEVARMAEEEGIMPAEALQVMSESGTAARYAADLCVALHVIPPADPAERAWLSCGDAIAEALDAGVDAAAAFPRVRLWGALAQASDNPVALAQRVEALREALVADATARGEYGRVELEVSFYRGNYFFWSLFGYLVSFMFAAIGWMLPTPRSRGARIGMGAVRAFGYLALAAATASLITGITMRCIIRARPPVSTLYETILFITAVAVLVCVVMEWINRERIAIAVAPVLGVLGMFLANKYEMKEAVDTMPSLQAVLDTNFWLATHVTCITIGYAAGLLAGAVAHLYLLGRVFRFRATDDGFYDTVGRMVYGVLCFGLFFSFVGTMLGGIWANYSWGRFWGWDPKENGALMIVLWQLIILHARQGGYVRDFGVSVLAVAGACIVAFSWWGVNLLGVGLHSYGFTRGIWGALALYWGFEGVVMAAGFVWRLNAGRAARGRMT